MKPLTIEQRDEILLHMPLEWNSDVFYDWLDANTVEDERFCPKCGEVDCEQHGYAMYTLA